MSDVERVQELIAKAAKADRAEDAMKFSQAVCNAANATCALAAASNQKPK